MKLALLIAILGLSIWYGTAILNALNTPIKYEAYPSGECVAWVDEHGQHPCETLPVKHTTIFVSEAE